MTPLVTQWVRLLGEASVESSTAAKLLAKLAGATAEPAAAVDRDGAAELLNSKALARRLVNTFWHASYILNFFT